MEFGARLIDLTRSLRGPGAADLAFVWEAESAKEDHYRTVVSSALWPWRVACDLFVVIDDFPVHYSDM